MSVPADSPRTPAEHAAKVRINLHDHKPLHPPGECHVCDSSHALAALVALAEALRRIADEDDPLWGIGSETEFARAALAAVPSGQPEGKETAT